MSQPSALDGAMLAPADAAEPDAPIRDFLVRSKLFDPDVALRFASMNAGVASDIWLVEGGGLRLCVKRALPKLRVAADWFVPVERNANEAAWLRLAAEIAPGSAPRVLAADARSGVFAMEYLPPERYPNWKAQLLAGRVDPATAERVGAVLARLHSRAAARPDLRERFRSDAIFMAIRLEPYLLATAARHPDLRAVLEALAERTMATKRTLVHGDVSPKNILLGPAGPVFLDAECAWWGDPAFDVAFCLKHLLLKCLCHPALTDGYLGAFRALAQRYLAGVDWEDAGEFERRAASLLPGLFLARVDGKSPVEYLNDPAARETVRRAARAMLVDPPQRLADLAPIWRAEARAAR